MKKRPVPQYMLYPEGIREVAAREPIYRELTNLAMAPNTLTDLYYKPSIGMARARRQNPDSVPAVTDEFIAFGKSLIMTSAAMQAGGDIEHQQDARQYVEDAWPLYAEKMRQCPEFAKWLMDAGTLFSFPMFMFYTEVGGFLKLDEKARAALEPTMTYQMDVAVGEYHDLYGRPMRFFGHDPVMTWHCMNNSLWRGVRYRMPIFNYYMCQAGEGARVLDLCSGAFNTERRFGYLDRDLNQYVTACDLDPGIDKALPYFFKRPVSKYGFTLRHENMKTTLNDSEIVGQQHYVQAQGMMSYQVPETEENLYAMRRAFQNPKECDRTERCVFELETGTIEMVQAVEVLGLQDQNKTMQPEESASVAKDRIEKAIKRVGGFRIEKVHTDEGFYGPDVRPTTVVFVLEVI